MVFAPVCKHEIPTANDMWIEVFNTQESETGKKIGTYVMFSCPECHTIIDIKEKT